MYRWREYEIRITNISSMVWMASISIGNLLAFGIYCDIIFTWYLPARPHYHPLYILHLVHFQSFPSCYTSYSWFLLVVTSYHHQQQQQQLVFSVASINSPSHDREKEEEEDDEKKPTKMLLDSRFEWCWCWDDDDDIGYLNQLKLMFRIKLITDKLLLVEFLWTLFWYHLILTSDALCI